MALVSEETWYLPAYRFDSDLKPNYPQKPEHETTLQLREEITGNYMSRTIAL